MLKKSSYNICLPLDNRYVIFNGISRRFFLVSKENKDRFLQVLASPNTYMQEYDFFIERMKEEGFIIEDTFDEFGTIKEKYKEQTNSEVYNLMILPTYACNVSCWYCTQRHRNIHLNEEDVLRIKKHIQFYLENNVTKGLQLSWFGGEPLINFDIVRNISSFAKEYCDNHGLHFGNSITTNGTLLTKQMLEVMKEQNFIFFQITVDGTRIEHDKIKVIKGKSAYEITLKNICLIAETLPNAEICLRYNYTSSNLKPNDFIKDLNLLLPAGVRPHILLSFIKVWQEDDEKIDEHKINILAKMARNAGYKVKVGADFAPCYVEDLNFNCIFPNGLVDKCNNIDPESCRGHIDESGKIKWDGDIRFFEYNIFSDNQSECRHCKYLPLCFGPCPKERETSYKVHSLQCRFSNKEKRWNLSILQYCRNILESSSTVFTFLLSLFLSFVACGSAFSQVDTIRQDSVARNVRLGEITVKGKLVTSYPDKDVWHITRDMRKGTLDTFSLLQKIPGFIYDRFSKTLSYMGTSNILITINGMEKGNDLGGNLANMRFKDIEIYQHPKGRHDGYDIVVNLIPYEDWQGYDLISLATAELLPSSKYGNLLCRVLPDVLYAYTRPKFDVSASYSYQFEDKRRSQRLDMKENDVGYVSIENTLPTNTDRMNRHEGYVDFDYKIDKSHTVSAKYTYTGNCDHSGSKHRLVKTTAAMAVRDGSFVATKEPSLWREGASHYDVQEHTFSLFYQMSVRKWHLYSELTYNTYSEKNEYSLSESQGFSTSSNLENSRRSLLLLAEADRGIASKGNLKFGIQMFARKYGSDDLAIGQRLESKYYRERPYVNLSGKISDKMSGSIGALVEFIQDRPSVSTTESQFIWGGNATLRYGQWGDKFRFDLNYRSTTSYPMLYQKTPIRNNSDSLLIYSGNPSLKASVLHRLFLNARYKKIGLTANLLYSPNAISPVFRKTDNHITRTFDNIESLEYQLNLGFYPKDIILNDGHIHYTVQIRYGGNYMNQPYTSKFVSYWMGLAQVSYSHPKIGSIQLDYRRLSKKTLSEQAVSLKANDGWHLMIAKDFFDSRLDCSLEYVLPIKLGVTQDSYSNTIIPYYSRFTTEQTFDYQKNRISLHLTYHLAKGHRVTKKKNEQTRENEIYNNYY